MWNVCKANAARRGLEFSITRAWIEKRLRAGVCEATGIPFDLTRTEGRRVALHGPSIDRTDPTIGYTWWNTKVVVWMYNACKGEGHHEDVVRFARAVACPEPHQ